MRPALSLQDACEIRARYQGEKREIERLATEYRTTFQTVVQILAGDWFDDRAALEIESMDTPIHEVVRRIQRLPLAHKVAHVRALVEIEEKKSQRTLRYGELTSLLASIQTRRLQLNK